MCKEATPNSPQTSPITAKLWLPLTTCTDNQLPVREFLPNATGARLREQTNRTKLILPTLAYNHFFFRLMRCSILADRTGPPNICWKIAQFLVASVAKVTLVASIGLKMTRQHLKITLFVAQVELARLKLLASSDGRAYLHHNLPHLFIQPAPIQWL